VLKSYAQFQRFQNLDELIPPAHAKPSVASSSRSAPASNLIVNLLTRLGDHLTRGFQSVDDQFQALQTQVTKGFQSMLTQLQELEVEVAQIQINVRNTLRHLMPEDQQDLMT
jgi:hypothetical protein